MAGFRTITIKGINKATRYIPPQLLSKLSRQKLILPVYHTVSDKALPHLKYLYQIKSTKAFEDDIDFLLKQYQPLDLQQFQAFVRNKTQPKKASFLLTFDDGLREFHDIIAPILQKKGVPAICFLNSDFVDNKDLFYRFKASILIHTLKSKPKLSTYRSVKKWQQKWFKSNTNIIQPLLRVNYQNKECLDELAILLKVDFDEYLTSHKPYLSSIQISSLIKRGFHFGAHSIDHPEYQYLTLEEQLRQTIESVETITRKFRLDYKVFAFPFTDYGISKAFFYFLEEHKITDLTFGCAGQKQEKVRNHFQRIPFEINDLSAKEIHNAELLYYLMKVPFGKNTLERK